MKMILVFFFISVGAQAYDCTHNQERTRDLYNELKELALQKEMINLKQYQTRLQVICFRGDQVTNNYITEDKENNLKIIISAALWEYLSIDAVAMIIAHEIGHIAKGHWHRKRHGSILKKSRELQADRFAIRLLKHSRYDAKASIEAIKTTKKLLPNGKFLYTIFGTDSHPSHWRRVINNWLSHL